MWTLRRNISTKKDSSQLTGHKFPTRFQQALPTEASHTHCISGENLQTEFYGVQSSCLTYFTQHFVCFSHAFAYTNRLFILVVLSSIVCLYHSYFYILFMDIYVVSVLASGYMDVFTLSKFMDIYPYDLFVIYVMVHFKKL